MTYEEGLKIAQKIKDGIRRDASIDQDDGTDRYFERVYRSVASQLTVSLALALAGIHPEQSQNPGDSL